MKPAFVTDGGASKQQGRLCFKGVIVPIDMVSPGLDCIVSSDQDIEELGNGYLVAEGPL